MAYWLVKTEPQEYSFYDLQNAGGGRWDGVRNFLALKHIKAMLPGDHVFVYHTGKEKAVVGVAEVVSEPYADPAQTDDRFFVVDLAARYRLTRPVTLAVIKTLSEFPGWELVKQPRLSVVPVTEAGWQRIHSLAEM